MLFIISRFLVNIFSDCKSTNFFSSVQIYLYPTPPAPLRHLSGSPPAPLRHCKQMLKTFNETPHNHIIPDTLSATYRNSAHLITWKSRMKGHPLHTLSTSSPHPLHSLYTTRSSYPRQGTSHTPLRHSEGTPLAIRKSRQKSRFRHCQTGFCGGLQVEC